MIKRVIVIISLLLATLPSFSQSVKVFSSLGMLNDATIAFKDNSINFRVLCGIQTPYDAFIVAGSMSVSFSNWGQYNRQKGGDWKVGAFIGVDPFTFIDQNSYFKGYLVAEFGYSNLTGNRERGCCIYAETGIRLYLGTDKIGFFVQDVVGVDHNCYNKDNIFGHRLEAGLQITIPSN